MGKYTEKLNLYLTDTTPTADGGFVDGNDVLNFDRDFNDNFQKIDDYVANNESNLLTKADKSYTDKIFNRIYDGVNLEEKFADEIAKFANKWVWIQSRIKSGNYDGILIGDYLTTSISSGTVNGSAVNAQTFQMQVAGIDTYTGCCDVEQGHHIDFISREVIDTEFKWNPTDNNNGTSAQPNPFLASMAYAILNGVNNYSTSAYNKVAHGANCNGAGIWQLLSADAKSVIVQKRQLTENKYDANSLLFGSKDWTWRDIGNLWLPNEHEVYGTQVRGNLAQTQYFWNPDAQTAIAYPIFLGAGRNRIKRMSNGGRSAWWLSSTVTHNTADVAHVGANGEASSSDATVAGYRFPLCFRVS